MLATYRFIVVLMASTTGCTQITDSNAPYTLTGTSSSSSGGGAGGTGGSGSGQCTKDADCPATALVCTVAACIDGDCGTRNATNGTPCIAAMPNVCDGQGACVECTSPAHCVTIVEDECTKRACVDHVCLSKHAGEETSASPTLQKPGDCKNVVCNGSGGTMTILDDSDAPDDGNPCTVNTCANGTPQITNLPANTNCGMGLYCNSTGQCIGCAKPSDCSGSYDFCKDRTCIANTCGVDSKALDTPLPEGDQTLGDCRIRVCDGAGNIITKVQTTDVPVDGNSCTQDACNGDGAPSNPPEPPNTTCSGGQCDGSGICLKNNGQTCIMASECLSNLCVDGHCCESDCTAICKSCGVTGSTGLCVNVPLGSTDDTCNDTKVCNGSALCKLANGQPCTTNGNCASGNCKNGTPKICQP